MDGLRILAEVRDEVRMPIVTEVLDVADVDVVAEYADMLQIGTRNMQNFALLQAVGATGKPVMLKRGLTATYEEWLMAAEYIAQRGNLDIVLCERGRALVRAGDPQHARRVGDRDGAAAEPPAGDRRPVARGGTARSRRTRSPAPASPPAPTA